MVGESRCTGLGLTLGCEGDEVALPVAAHASQSPAATPRHVLFNFDPLQDLKKALGPFSNHFVVSTHLINLALISNGSSLVVFISELFLFMSLSR